MEILSKGDLDVKVTFRSLAGILVALSTALMAYGQPANPPSIPPVNPSEWVANYDDVPGTTTENASVGRLTVEYQSSLSARDVGRLYIPTASGIYAVQVLASGSSGMVVDVFDETKSNGTYAVYGSTTPGTLTLTFQTQTAKGSAWTTQGTLNIAVGPERKWNTDNAVDISSWYICPPAYSANTITQAQFTTLLNNDFAAMQSQGFSKVSVDWNPVLYPAVLFNAASQNNLKVMFYMAGTDSYIKNNAIGAGGHNQPVLEMESVLIQDGMTTNVGTGSTVLMMNHPNLGTYYLSDEPPSSSARTLELAAMVSRSLDPNHTGAATLAGTTWNVLQSVTGAPFLGIQMFDPYPLGNTNASNRTDSSPATGNPSGAQPSSASDFSYHYPFTNNSWEPQMTWPDYLQWVQSLRPGVPDEILFQAFSGNPAAIYWRDPSPTEVGAQAYMALARGARAINYFTYNSESQTAGGEELLGLIDQNGNPTAKWTEAGVVNAKIKGWLPILTNLAVSSSPSNAHIPYPAVGPFNYTFFDDGFENTSTCASNVADECDAGAGNWNTGTGAAITQSSTLAHSGSYSGLATSSNGNTPFIDDYGPYSDINWVRFPRFSSASMGGWVNVNGAANMSARFGAQTNNVLTGYFDTWGGYSALGPGWNYLSTDLSAVASAPTSLYSVWLEYQANSSGAYANQYLDDITLTGTIAPYTPNYMYQGGVAGNFVNTSTGTQYVVLVNTDTVNTKTVAANVTGTNGAAAATAQDVDSGTVYSLSGGVLSLSIAPGDAHLLAIDSTTGATSTATVLTSSLNPSTLDTPVTYTAHVSPSTATGTVTFMDGTTSLATVTLSSGVAAYTTSPQTFGAHYITAYYSGNSTYAKSTSSTLTETVNTPSGVPVFANNSFETPTEDGTTEPYGVTNPSGSSWTWSALCAGIQGNGSYWQAANAPDGTQTAFLQGYNGTGCFGSVSQSLVFPAGTYTLSFYGARRAIDAGATQPIAVTVDGTAIGGHYTPASTSAFNLITTPPFTVTEGSHTIAFAATDNTGNKTSFIDRVTIAQAPAQTAVTLTSSLNPSNLNQLVTLTAAVVPWTSTGTVTFLDGTTALSTVTLSEGVAAYATSELTTGSHSITASYSGDANDAASTSSVLTEIVNTPTGGAFANSSFETPSAPGTTDPYGVGNPSGSSWTWSALCAGIQGNGSYWGAPNAPDGAQTAYLQGYSGTGCLGSVSQSVVTSQAGAYTLSFYGAQRNADGGAVQPIQVTVDGVAIGGPYAPASTTGYNLITASPFMLTAGSHTIMLAATDNTGNATSFIDVATIDPSSAGSTTTAVASSLNPATLNTPVTLKTTVAPSTATGTVTFRDGTTVLGTGALSGGMAQVTTTALAAGSHSITAVYSGDANDAVSKSPVLTQVVSTTSGGPSFANLSFETPAANGTAVPYGLGNPTGSSWTWSALSAGIQGNGSYWAAPSAPDGTQAAYIQGANSNLGSVSQSITLPAGTYTLSFYGAQRGIDGGATQPIAVTVDGLAIGGPYTPASTTAFNLITTPSFTVNAGSHTIMFAATNGSGNSTTFIDLVTINPL